MSIKLILCIPLTPLFIAFAGTKKFYVRFLQGVFSPEISDDLYRFKTDIIRSNADKLCPFKITFEGLLVRLAVKVPVNADIDAAFSHLMREFGESHIRCQRRIVDHENVLFRMFRICLG